jgi:hypothetical protein
MYTNNRDAYREFFFTVWQKYQRKLPLDATEARLAEVMLQHPEYHAMLGKPEMGCEFAVEENPFVHMSLHLALREQIGINRPVGIENIYQQLLSQHHHAHIVEHLMMECLCRMMSAAQQTDEAYLQLLRAL